MRATFPSFARHCVLVMLMKHFQTNIAVEWPSLLRLQEVQVSNLGTDVCYPNYVFLWFSQSLQALAGIVPRNRSQLVPCASFQFIIHTLLTVRCCITDVREALLNNLRISRYFVRCFVVAHSITLHIKTNNLLPPFR
jgi:hypothetical protein